MGTRVGWTLLGLFVFVAFDMLFCAGMLTGSWIGQTPFYLAFGWIPYLVRTLPSVTIDPAGVATVVVALAALMIGVHLFGRWWIRNSGRPQEEPPAGADEAAAVHAWAESRETRLSRSDVWPVRKTIACVLLVMLLFVAGLSGTGVAHQASWLATSPEPLLNTGRNPARRTQSKNNLKQIGLALHIFHDESDALPAGGTFDGAGRGLHSWQTFLLPYAEQGPLYERIDLVRAWNHPANGEAVATSVPIFRNPGVDRNRASDAPGRPAPSHYAANAHLFGANRQMTFEEVTDGLSNTLLSGEAAGNFRAWADPTNVRDPVLGINKTADGFGEPWEGGARFLLGDGSVRFINEEIDPAVLKALSTPGAGDRVGEF